MEETERPQEFLCLRGLGLRESMRAGIRGEETVVERLHQVRARALQEQLGDQHPVGIVRLAPRKLATVLPEPAGHAAAKPSKAALGDELMVPGNVHSRILA